MKLRIKGNTIRLRLTKSEVDYFEKHSFIEEQTTFIDNIFSYCLQTRVQDDVTVVFENNKITVTLPVKISKEWTATNLVGCSGEMDIHGGKKLYILVEKDFKCLDEVTEDQSDNYDNPAANNK